MRWASKSGEGIGDRRIPSRRVRGSREQRRVGARSRKQEVKVTVKDFRSSLVLAAAD